MDMLFKKSGQHYLMFGVMGFLVALFLLFGNSSHKGDQALSFAIEAFPYFFLAVLMTYRLAVKKVYNGGHFVLRFLWSAILWVITIAISGAIAAVLFSNVLLALLVLIGSAVMAILAMRPVKMVNFAVTQRGVKIDDSFYPYTTLENYYIEEDDFLGPQLLIQSQKMFMPLLILPLPEDDVEGIENIIAERLPEEHLEEPFANKILEFFGF